VNDSQNVNPVRLDVVDDTVGPFDYFSNLVNIIFGNYIRELCGLRKGIARFARTFG
jgi:hypothetical protein